MGCGKVHLQGLGVLLIKVIMICELVKVFHGFSQVGDSYYRGYSFGNSKHGTNSIVPIH
jgi:hypothetical protein